MLIEDNPFPVNMLLHEEGSATASKDNPASTNTTKMLLYTEGWAAASRDDPASASTNVKTTTRPIEDEIHPITVKLEPANNIVFKAGDMECSAGKNNSHIRTYKPKANIIDGKWHDGRKDLQPRRIPKPAVTFGQLLAK